MCGGHSGRQYVIPRTYEQGPVQGQEQVTGQTCPTCGAPVAPDFVVCPNCGTQLKTACPNCHKAVDISWVACPYCGASLQGLDK